MRLKLIGDLVKSCTSIIVSLFLRDLIALRVAGDHLTGAAGELIEQPVALIGPFVRIQEGPHLLQQFEGTSTPNQPAVGNRAAELSQRLLPAC